ncbi:MAG: ATP-binding protein [Bacteroidota bacterium]
MSDITIPQKAWEPTPDLDRFSSILKERLDEEPDLVGYATPPFKELQPAQFSMIKGLDEKESLIVMLCLVAKCFPERLHPIYEKMASNHAYLALLGGKKQKESSIMTPTGRTALFLIAGHDPQKRMENWSYFNTAHRLYQQGILEFSGDIDDTITLTDEYVHRFTTGKPYQPQYSLDFPAKKISTGQRWDELIVDTETRGYIDEVKAWIKHHQQLVQNPNFSKEITGYRCLFYGPSGTGKTLTVKLLGKEVGMDVYRIDLSKIVSKYVGETEKNLGNIFDKAAHRNWMLFFDEGDALFGKRTATNSSNDRYANQEVSYLLQKIEDHPGVIILATNLKQNMDGAFLRRFQSEVEFKMPEEEERKLLWQHAFSGDFQIDAQVDLNHIAKRYIVSGAAIKNVKHYTAIMAMERQSNTVIEKEFLEGLRKELVKDGRRL